MPLQSLSPGVQNAQKADLGSKMVGIGGYLKQRLCTGLKQETEKDSLILPNQWDQRMRDAEDQMIVVHRQQLPLARR